jgi:fructokinase
MDFMKIDVLALGELLADLISEDYVNTLSEAKKFHLYQGGSPANLCANLKWLGKETELVACVGNDSIGDFLSNVLMEIGLSGKYIERDPNLPSSLVLVGKSKASPDFIAYRMADTQIKRVSNHVIEAATIIHTSAFALSKEPARTNILSALKTASQLGKIISCDWNFAPEIWGNNSGEKVFGELVQLNPLLKFSLDDFARFTGIIEPEPKQAMEFLNSYNLSFACITCGSEGVWFINENKQWNHLAAIKVEVKDTTGAGDAFWAGFLASYLNGKTNSDSVQDGIKLAAKKIQQLGPLYLG